MNLDFLIQTKGNKKMKKFINIVFLILTPIYLFAHSLVLNILDNQDDTITVEGMFNTGESAAGALIKIETLDSGETLFQQRLSDDTEMIIEIPKVPYKVILDGGPGHTAEKEGIPPKAGFQKVEKKEEPQKKKEERPSRNNMQISSSPVITISIILAFILLFATIIISIKNTNRLINELKNS